MKPEQDTACVTPRRAYQKPRLRVVELAVKEVLAIGCKTATTGPNSGEPVCSGMGPCTASDSS